MVGRCALRAKFGAAARPKLHSSTPDSIPLRASSHQTTHSPKVHMQPPPPHTQDDCFVVGHDTPTAPKSREQISVSRQPNTASRMWLRRQIRSSRSPAIPALVCPCQRKTWEQSLHDICHEAEGDSTRDGSACQHTQASSCPCLSLDVIAQPLTGCHRARRGWVLDVGLCYCRAVRPRWPVQVSST